MNVEKERKVFGEWLKKENIFSGNDNNPDVVWAKKFMFKAWQASANREGYKLVPVVDTDAMWSAGRAVIEDNGYSADVSDVYKAMIGACDAK